LPIKLLLTTPTSGAGGGGLDVLLSLLQAPSTSKGVIKTASRRNIEHAPVDLKTALGNRLTCCVAVAFAVRDEAQLAASAWPESRLSAKQLDICQ
jgi:hypothetical protein